MRLVLLPNKMTISLFGSHSIPYANKASKQIGFDSLLIFSYLNRKLFLPDSHDNCKQRLLSEKEIRLLCDSLSNAKDIPKHMKISSCFKKIFFFANKI